MTCGGKGVCVGSFCEIKGFCPIELSTPSASQLITFSGIGDMSVFARVDTIFEKFGERHSNVAQDSIGVCTLQDSEATPGCGAPNQFNVGEMLRRAGVDLDSSILETGVEILISVTWADANPMFATKVSSSSEQIHILLSAKLFDLSLHFLFRFQTTFRPLFVPLSNLLWYENPKFGSG